MCHGRHGLLASLIEHLRRLFAELADDADGDFLAGLEVEWAAGVGP